MTREEAIKELTSEFMNSGHIEWITDVINSIDSFESRTCENCKYSQMSEYYGHLLCRWENADGFNVGFIYDYDCDHEVPKDFGCNKWESKDD